LPGSGTHAPSYFRTYSLICPIHTGSGRTFASRAQGRPTLTRPTRKQHAKDRDPPDRPTPPPQPPHRIRPTKEAPKKALTTVDATKSVIAIENVHTTIDQIAQTTLRKVVGRHTLDETDREKRAKTINAEGESLAAAALGDTSDTMTAHPLALQLRNLQSLAEIGVDKNTTVVFPAPLTTTITEPGTFLTRENTAARAAGAAIRPAVSSRPPNAVVAANGKPDLDVINK
jgi:regulator of protease activity HflC (stomatin/prohibitin superfamily)